MITSHLIKRLTVLAALLIVATVIPEAAGAKYSKACSKFSYDSIDVQVVDRRNEIGQHHNTYGYTNFFNKNKVGVTIKWLCYGVLKNGNRLVWLDEGTFNLDPGEHRGEVYSYGYGKFKHTDFSKYVVAIDVTKIPETPPVNEGSKIREIEEPTPVKATPEGSVGADNADKVYAYLQPLMTQNRFSQDDYTLAVRWLRYTIDEVILPRYEKAVEHKKKDEISAANWIREQSSELIKNWQDMYQYVNNGYTNNKLTRETGYEFIVVKNRMKYTIR